MVSHPQYLGPYYTSDPCFDGLAHEAGVRSFVWGSDGVGQFSASAFGSVLGGSGGLPK